MGNQSCSIGNRVFNEQGLLEVGSRLEQTLKRGKESFKTYSGKLMIHFEDSQRSKIIRFWIIAVLMAFGTLTYYACCIPLVNETPLRALYNAPHDLFRAIFLIPIIYAALVFRVRGSLIASFVFLCVILPRAFLESPYPFAVIRVIVFVTITTFISLLVAVGSNRIDKEKENTKLLQFLADCLGKQEGEKQHLAREIHDGSLQDLLDISHDVDALAEIEDRKDIKVRLKYLRDKADYVQDGLRRLITDLRPPLLEELGLESSLKWLADKMSEEQSIEVSVQIYGRVRRLTNTVELSLFRIAQEALQNAKKHSMATKIQIRLAFIGNKIYLTVQDNGVGFAIPAQDKLAIIKKFGLIGMTERARVVGGSLRIESGEGKGTTVFIEVPIKSDKFSKIMIG